MASPASAPAASARVHRVVRPARSPTRPPARVAPRHRPAASSSSRSDRDGAAAEEGPVVVAVVTTASCPHCRRAKAAIAAAGIAFEEIDASAPDGVVLDAARKLSGMRTVPQVFVGGVCYGGADDVDAGIADGDFPAAVASAGARAASEEGGGAAAGADGGPVPRAIRAAVSESNGATPETGSTVVADQIHQMQDQIRDEEYERLSRLCAQMAATIAPRDAWTFAGFPAWPPFVKERTVVTGADVVAWLDRDGKGGGGLADANAMLDRGLVATTGRRGCGFDDASPWRDSLFRLSDHACEPVGWPRVTMGAMNARRRWRGSNRRPARLVASDLRARILSMYDEHLSQDGTFVDYAAMAKSPAFEAYVDATAELQTVDLRELDRDEKIAFFLNVYNAMIVHVTCAVGPPRAGFFGFFDRLTFFDRFRYDIGGVPWSCDDIEHGALRGNRPGAASFGPLVGAPSLSPGPFAPNDPRRAHCVLPVDPRVHFALVCGARSCPPIRTYDAAGLDAQLAAAAEAFVDGDVAVVDADAGTFRCSKIIGEWYAEDFGVDDAERLRRVAGYLPRGSAKREAIEAALARGGVKLVTAEYDWTLNGKSA